MFLLVLRGENIALDVALWHLIREERCISIIGEFALNQLLEISF